VPIHKFDKSVGIKHGCFRTAFSDHDEKTALYLNDILKFDSIIALLVAEHILSSTVALTNYFQKRDIDLLEAVTT
jgi:hypothetical protein